MQQWRLMLVVILAGFASIENTEAQVVGKNTTLTVQVTDYAQVDAKTLGEAEQVAVAIFRNARVQTRWVDMSGVAKRSLLYPNDLDLSVPPYVQIHILSQDMASLLGMPDNVMGLAPGKGPDRHLVYVFYAYVRLVAERQVREHMKGAVPRYATAAQILGTMMAHELGHILLNLPSHSKTGIMRGNWDLTDLCNIGYGYLLFTPQQAEVIRSDVSRRAKLTEEAKGNPIP
jgi:hypothetical protein